MRKKNPNSKESGIALLLAIFTLLLLAALGLALLCAADLETNIAANYRDKQVSIYGAMSGLQEARDRLIPALCDPTTDGSCIEAGIDTSSLQLPTLSNGGVIYIINPKDASEQVQPWSPTLSGKPNAYFDNELCHEQITALGMTYVPYSSGICPADSSHIPSGSAWYQVRSNLDSSTAKEYFANTTAYPKPLTFKWVRITLKTDNMTPALAMGGGPGGYGTAMCWDPSQGQVPASSGPGYNIDCTSKRGVVLYNGANVCSPTCSFDPPIGLGYVNPVVTISGGGGSGATATAHVTQTPDGKITGIYVNPGANGSGYTSAPTVTIDPPLYGTQATATATIVAPGAPVTGFSAVTQTNPAGCYSATPSVTIDAPPGAGTTATATATMSGNTCIAKWTIGLNGKCSSSGTDTLSAVGGGGNSFSATVVIANNKQSISSATITNPGSGYASKPTGVSGTSHGCSYTVTWTLGTQVSSVNLTNGGSGYTNPPAVNIAAPTTPSGSAPPSVTANLGAGAANAGQVTGFTITNQGSGYTSVPNVTLSGGGGTGAAATAVLTPTGTIGQIDSITLVSPGSGYTSNPIVTITDVGGGTGATIQAQAGSQTQLGRVYLLTALAVGPGGSRTMTQMEVATPVSVPFPSSMPAALTLDAFSVNINPGSSENYKVIGNDANSSGGTLPTQPPKPSVGVIDNPNTPTSPSSVSCITSVLGGAPNPACPASGGVKSSNYYGKGASPDVENVYGSLGDLTTPAGADELATAIEEKANYTNVSPVTLVSNGQMKYNTSNPSASICPTVVITGDLTITGGGTYCGVLLVTGNLTLQGNYTWYGPVFVIGQGGTFTGGGGGNGQIIGTLFIAQTRNPDGTLRSTLGTPTVSFQLIGGGGNGIQYDSNWSDRLIANLNLQPVKSSSPLKILSIRNIY